jgi:hypothetical protein
MEQSSWKAASFVAGLEIYRILCNPKIYRCVGYNPPLAKSQASAAIKLNSFVSWVITQREVV